MSQIAIASIFGTFVTAVRLATDPRTASDRTVTIVVVRTVTIIVRRTFGYAIKHRDATKDKLDAISQIGFKPRIGWVSQFHLHIFG